VVCYKKQKQKQKQKQKNTNKKTRNKNKNKRPSGKRLLTIILYCGVRGDASILDLCSSTVAHGVQVFLHRLFHVVGIMGDEGHGVNNFLSKYLLYSWIFCLFSIILPF